ncbi:MAG: HIT family protein [Victivallales bacterium]|jgi:histidine triad (HIT) family protein|nr:HIT family protein [Victivallales bacterium]MBR6076026.1 HIT family protein [Victivallales bacterium]MBR6323395.1 HIT family protein [Victivallales bacterium]
MPLVKECVFCKIIRGEIPCCKVYEDDLILAFLDIAPFNIGHTVIIPKDHQNSITTLDEIYANRIIKMAPKIGVALMRTINAEGFNLFLNNGSVAGQTVWHCHMHVLPRFAGDKVVISSEPQKYDSMDQMAELAGKLFNKLNAQ